MHFNLADQYHHRESIVHGLNPRVKVLGVVLYIFAVGLLPEGEWLGFLLYFLFLIISYQLSGLEFFFVLRRSLIALPFLLAAFAIPFTTPGDEWMKLPIIGWTITETGAIRFASIVIRAWLAVQAAVVLISTTRIPDLFWSLSALGMPSILVSTINFMYRYLFVLADEVLRMLRARSARSPRLPHKPKPPVLWEGRVAGSMVGSLFIRSIERSERVYSAMLSRGFDGRVLVKRKFKMKQTDWIIMVAVIAFVFMSQGLIHLR
ncbi:MAG: cobalt ECF transporter T component CbiQ [Anaerolineales bacterium]|nr:cobalt ECF transporter T component CbiQ [Anaerolineales bacterium]